jgi:hypothetical protein
MDDVVGVHEVLMCAPPPPAGACEESHEVSRWGCHPSAASLCRYNICLVTAAYGASTLLTFELHTLCMYHFSTNLLLAPVIKALTLPSICHKVS